MDEQEPKGETREERQAWNLAVAIDNALLKADPWYGLKPKGQYDRGATQTTISKLGREARIQAVILDQTRARTQELAAATNGPTTWEGIRDAAHARAVRVLQIRDTSGKVDHEYVDLFQAESAAHLATLEILEAVTARQSADPDVLRALVRQLRAAWETTAPDSTKIRTTGAWLGTLLADRDHTIGMLEAGKQETATELARWHAVGQVLADAWPRLRSFPAGEQPGALVAQLPVILEADRKYTEALRTQAQAVIEAFTAESLLALARTIGTLQATVEAGMPPLPTVPRRPRTTPDLCDCEHYTGERVVCKQCGGTLSRPDLTEPLATALREKAEAIAENERLHTQLAGLETPAQLVNRAIRHIAEKRHRENTACSGLAEETAIVFRILCVVAGTQLQTLVRRGTAIPNAVTDPAAPSDG